MEASRFQSSILFPSPIHTPPGSLRRLVSQFDLKKNPVHFRRNNSCSDWSTDSFPCTLPITISRTGFGPRPIHSSHRDAVPVPDLPLLLQDSCLSRLLWNWVGIFDSVSFPYLCLTQSFPAGVGRTGNEASLRAMACNAGKTEVIPK